MSSLFLADENIPRICVMALREHGFDVSWISETSASIPDTGVCTLAQAENRVIITSDKDFGDSIRIRTLSNAV